MATRSSILAQEIPCTEESGGLQSVELQESDTATKQQHCLLQKKVCLGFFAHFLIGLFVFLLLSCTSCAYILDTKSFSLLTFANFLPVRRLSFCFAYDFLCCAKACKFDQVSFVQFHFYFYCLERLILGFCCLVSFLVQRNVKGKQASKIRPRLTCLVYSC